MNDTSLIKLSWDYLLGSSWLQTYDSTGSEIFALIKHCSVFSWYEAVAGKVCVPFQVRTFEAQQAFKALKFWTKF